MSTNYLHERKDFGDLLRLLEKETGIFAYLIEKDIHIHPPKELDVNTNPKKTKANQIKSRKEYYDWLAQNITIDGIVNIERDTYSRK